LRSSRKTFFRQIPLFRFLTPFVFGSIAGIFSPSLVWALACAGFVIVYTVVSKRIGHSSFGPGFVVVSLFVGYALACFNTERLYDTHYSQQLSLSGRHVIQGRVISDPLERAQSVRVEFGMDATLESDQLQPMQGKLLVYFQKSTASLALRHNDELIISVSLNELPSPRNPNEFDYRRYMLFHQIAHQAYVSDNDWKLTKKGSGFLRAMNAFRRTILSRFESLGLYGKEHAIVSALVVGYKHHLTADQVNAFASAGAMHVLAVSGLHVGILYLILTTVLRPLKRWVKSEIGIIMLLLVLLWAYAVLTGLSPSVTRATTMFSFVAISKLLNRNAHILNTLAASATFLLIIDPFLIVEVGFQLSYLAVAGIVLLQPLISRLYTPKYVLVKKIWDITSVSLAAQLATFPLGLLYFHQFPVYFLLSNLVVIPAAMVIIPLGILSLLLSSVPVLSYILGALLQLVVSLLDGFIHWVQALPYALMQGIDISIFETYFIYMVVLTSVLFLLKKRHKWFLRFAVMLCIIEVINIMELISQRDQHAVVLFNVREYAPVNIIRGRQHVFYCDDELVEDEESMRFHMRHHWWHRGLQPPSDSFGGVIVDKGLYVYHGICILKLDQTVMIDSLGHVDVLWILERTAQPPVEVLERVLPNHVILGNTLDWGSKKYWVKLLNQRDIPYSDYRDTIALTLTFDDEL